MRIITLFAVLTATCMSAAGPASADVLAPHWAEARAKWNAIADRAVAGDKQAEAQLMAAVNACAPDTDCFKSRGQMTEAQRTRLKAAWDACEEKPGLFYPLSPEQALDRCRRKLTNLTEAQIDAAAAAVNIGWILVNGKLGDPDPKSGYDYYAFAAEFDYPMAHHGAGQLLMGGKLGAPDLQKAATHYLKAGRLGVVDSWIALGELREKHGSEQPFGDFFFAMSATEGFNGKYSDADFFYRRALAEEPSEPQRKKLDEKLAPSAAARPKPASAAPKPAPAPAKPALREANMAAARDCISRADEMKRMKSKFNSMDRELRRMGEDLDETERHLRTVYNYAPEPGSPAAAAREWNYSEYDRKVAEYNHRARNADAFMDDVNRYVDSYNAKCGNAGIALTKAEYEAVCGGKTGNDFCKGFSFQ